MSKQTKQQKASAAPARASNDAGCVYRAVKAGEPAERVRELIEAYAQGSQERRKAVVNCESFEDGGETPIEAAHRLARGDLVGVLLEAGADATAIAPSCHPLALAIHYGLTDTLRVLLRSGRHAVNCKLAYDREGSVFGSPSDGPFARAVHLAVVPPTKPRNIATPRPRLDALEVLVREFGADVNAVDHLGLTPLHWLASAAKDRRLPALRALLSLGADVNAAGGNKSTPIFTAAQADIDLVQGLLAAGASPDRFDAMGWSPLMAACRSYPPSNPRVIPALLRASSTETLRAVDRWGSSAIDVLVSYGHYKKAWFPEAFSQLLLAGARVHARNAERVLPIAVRLGTHVEAALPPHWEVHEAVVGLAFDLKELWAAQGAVEARERRIAELEEELRRRGIGTEDAEDDETEEKEQQEDDGDEDKEVEATTGQNKKEEESAGARGGGGSGTAAADAPAPPST